MVSVQRGKLAFGALAAQPSSPPALVRGVIPVRTLVSGEYEFPTAKHQTECAFCVCCTDSWHPFVKDMWLTDSPRLRHPPHKCGGQGVYPLAYQNSPTNSQFIFLLRKGGNYVSIIYLTTYHGNPANSATRNCPSEKSGKLPLSARKSTVRFLFDGSKSAARKKSADFQKLSLTFPKDWV